MTWYCDLIFSCEFLSGESVSDKECDNLRYEFAQAHDALVHAVTEKEALTLQLAAARRDFDTISNATFWKLTKPARIILDTLKKLLHIC